MLFRFLVGVFGPWFIWLLRYALRMMFKRVRNVAVSTNTDAVLSNIDAVLSNRVAVLTLLAPCRVFPSLLPSLLRVPLYILSRSGLCGPLFRTIACLVLCGRVNAVTEPGKQLYLLSYTIFDS